MQPPGLPSLPPPHPTPPFRAPRRLPRYLTLKSALKSAVVAIARERYAADTPPDHAAARRALHNELYCLLADETRAVLAELAVPPRAAGSGVKAQASPYEPPDTVTSDAAASMATVVTAAPAQSPEAVATETARDGSGGGGAARGVIGGVVAGGDDGATLLELAEDCEEEGDEARAHQLHQQCAAGAVGAAHMQVRGSGEPGVGAYGIADAVQLIRSRALGRGSDWPETPFAMCVRTWKV